MRIKELAEGINKGLKEGTITENTPVIAIGEYGYGDDLRNVKILDKMVKTDGEYCSEPQTVFALGIDTYLHESEDFGYCDMWISEEDYDRFTEE